MSKKSGNKTNGTANGDTTAAPVKAPRAPRIVAGSVKLESSVALPAERGSYPFAEMKVGDSFLVPTGKEASCQASMSKAKKTLGFNLTIRTMEGGAKRCFRLEDPKGKVVA